MKKQLLVSVDRGETRVALLEAEYGTSETLDDVFKQACQYNDAQEVHEALERARQRSLVLAGVAQAVDEPGKQRRNVQLAQPLVGERGDRVTQLVVAQHSGQAADGRAELLGEPVRVGGFGQPVADALRDVR